MKLTYTKIFSGLVFSSTIVIALASQRECAKADTITQVREGVVIRSTNMVGKKTIKVPPKGNNNGVSKGSSAISSYSRGDSSIAASVTAYALKFIGSPYVYGAEGPRAFDCSGFTRYVYKNFGVNLDHYTGSQFRSGVSVAKNHLQPGDLVFFNTQSPIGHVGIYLGGGDFIHAPSSGKTVTVTSLNSSYYVKRYAGARRLLR
ncbi:C40 family peptidase [Clostridium polynesiense]|uniref:C40 family peptidase n=1 Tax=Clostridium polynesiense TaxID=1325933 RepID=UPI00058F5314|nr:C40 family peptidase [Clostridium polynesiense]